MADADVSNLRRDYRHGKLDAGDLLSDPIEQFQKWFEDAQAAGIAEPNAMSLATASPAGETTIRTVLLKGYGHDGFVFFTNLGSTKAGQIAQNPHVSLLFPWLPLERQVIINGTAARISLAEVARYFVTRPRESRIAAWVSAQSRVIDARRVLEAKFEEMVRKFGEGDIPVPSFWGGFRVAPKTIEFWQGGAHRLHDRFLYSREGEGWTIQRLAP
jgi:pyridoxamine 5'-phosphate oxidase